MPLIFEFNDSDCIHLQVLVRCARGPETRSVLLLLAGLYARAPLPNITVFQDQVYSDCPERTLC